MSVLEDTIQWFDSMDDHLSLPAQVACVLEEVGELVAEMTAHTPTQEQGLLDLSFELETVRKRISEDGITFTDRVATLDALCDIIVTCVGVARCLQMDILGALEEVNRSNNSKLDDDGKPYVIPETGKIGKGANYSAPDLAKFV